MLIWQGVSTLRGMKQGRGGENIRAKCVDMISKTIGNTTKVTIND